MKKVFLLFIAFVMIVSFVFWAISNAPLKENKTIKRAKMRKWSTIFLMATILILSLYAEQPITVIRIGLSFVVVSIAWGRIIENC